MREGGRKGREGEIIHTQWLNSIVQGISVFLPLARSVKCDIQSHALQFMLFQRQELFTVLFIAQNQLRW